ncbi:MAG: PP2C family protein-serine/threonine phosphatase, partial [Kiritimatiellia bacterium]
MWILSHNWTIWLLLLISGMCLWRLRRLRLERDGLLNEKDVIYNFLHDVSEVFTESVDVQTDTLLRRVLFYAQQTSKARAGAVYFVDPDGRTLSVRAISGLFPPVAERAGGVVVSVGVDAQSLEKEVRGRQVPVGEGLIGKVAAHNLPLLIEDAERDARVPRFENPMLEIRTIMLLPMRFKRTVLGVLVLVNRIDDTPFIQSDLNMLQALADQASVTLYFARFNEEMNRKHVLDADLQVARKIQKGMLPERIPALSGLDCAAFSLPAREVGGDYYDFIDVDAHHHGVVIADVSGKGVAGAIFMSICRSVFRAHAPGCLDPDAVLRAVNKVVAEDMQEDMFISVLYMIIDTRDYVVRMARAGHPPPMLVRVETDAVTVPEAEGIAVGMADPETFDAC